MDYSSLFSSWLSTDLQENNQKEIKNIVKDYLIKSGKYNLWKNCRFAEYSKKISLIYGTDFFNKYQCYLGVNQQLNSLEERCCKQIYDSNRSRNRRLKNKLIYQLENYDCLFLTLTFTDDVLNKTSKQTRRDYIRRYLKSLGSEFYVANIDFGDKEKNPESKGREHYHAIVNLDYIDLNSYNYGFIYAEKIKKTSKADVLVKYVNKLTCHAYKDSTKGRDRLIYSR